MYINIYLLIYLSIYLSIYPNQFQNLSITHTITITNNNKCMLIMFYCGNSLHFNVRKTAAIVFLPTTRASHKDDNKISFFLTYEFGSNTFHSIIYLQRSHRTDCFWCKSIWPSHIVCRECPLIFALPKYSYAKPSATEVWFFWSRTGGGRWGEEEKRTWQINLSCFQTVIYENRIL